MTASALPDFLFSKGDTYFITFTIHSHKVNQRTKEG